MKRLLILAGLAVAHGLVYAQPAPSLVVGSGGFYSPVVANLEEAVAFYRDGLGFEFQGEPRNADSNPQLRQLYGLPDARLRWQVGRAPGIPAGIEVVEISSAGGQRLDRNIREPSVVMLMVIVKDIDAAFARVKATGAPVVTRGGNPVNLDLGLRAVVVKDPAGHFVELLQPTGTPPNQPGTGDIRNIRVRHTVEDLDRAVALYRDALGLREGGPASARWISAPSVVELLGVPRNTRYRFITLNVPGSGLPIELIEFRDGRGVLRPDVTIVDVPASGDARDLVEIEAALLRAPDVGATRIELRVSNIDAAAAALVQAGGAFISTGGQPLDLPAGNSTVKAGVVRDPDHLFLVLINTPAAQP